MLVPREPTLEDVQLVKLTAISWLRQVACNPGHKYEVCEPCLHSCSMQPPSA